MAHLGTQAARWRWLNSQADALAIVGARCDVGAKRHAFGTLAAADAAMPFVADALRILKGRDTVVPVRSYRCDGRTGCGAWHHTSQPRG